MSSLALMRLLSAKNGTNLLISRHFYSINCFKRNTEKLLLNNWSQKNNSLFNNSENEKDIRRPLCRLMSTNAEKAVSHDHNHSRIWSVERFLSIGLLGVIPISFMTSMPAMDYLLSLSLVTHIHWGVEAIVVDYIRPNIFGQFIPKLALGSVYLLSILSLGGLFYFNYTDVGLVQAIRMIAKM